MSEPIPGPRPLPLLGHLPQITLDPLGFLQRLVREHGDVTTFRFGRKPVVFLNDPKHIMQLLRDRHAYRSPETRTLLEAYLGVGLLSLEGNEHMRHRRLMQPAFHKQRIQGYVDVMIDETYRAVDAWLVKGEIDLRTEMTRLTFSVVARALFSAELMGEAIEVDHALRSLTPPFVLSLNLTRTLGLPPLALYLPRTRKGISQLHSLVGRIVERRRREGGDRGDLLSMLLATRDEDGSELTDAEIAGEALTILLAGHDTTAYTLSWATLLLTQHPEIADALAREAQSVLGARELGIDDLSRLGLASRIVKETMRLYPAAWLADRVPSSDTKFGRYTVPAGTSVLYSAYVTQRDPRHFPNPDRFDPDRFLPEREPEHIKDAYLPFGAGAHMCIGNNFALVEAQVVLSIMAQRLSIVSRVRGAIKPQPRVVLEMAEPFPVSVTRR